MKLSIKRLKEIHACRPQVALFRELFGEAVEVTETTCIAVVDKFDWDWAAVKLLDATAWEEYNRIHDAAWEEYNRIMDTAWEEYHLDPDGHHRKCAGDTAWEEYNRAKAAAFGRIFDSQRCEERTHETVN